MEVYYYLDRPLNKYGELILNHAIYKETIHQLEPLQHRTAVRLKFDVANTIGYGIARDYELTEIETTVRDLNNIRGALIDSRVCTEDTAELAEEYIVLMAVFIALITSDSCPQNYRNNDCYAYMDDIVDEELYWREFRKYIVDKTVLNENLQTIYSRLLYLIETLQLNTYNTQLWEQINQYMETGGNYTKQ